MKIIFLDVDGVLNSYRNVIAQGGFPFPKSDQRAQNEMHKEENLDSLAVGMIRKLASEFDAKIVLHSTWRLFEDPIEFGKRWNLPIIAGTLPGDKRISIRKWIEDNPEISQFVVIDDEDMQINEKYQVKTDLMNGFDYYDYLSAKEILRTPEEGEI